MNRFNPDELKALRRAALAVDQSDVEVTTRLEAAYDQISFLLALVHDQSSTDTLVKVCSEIERLVEKLTDTLTIAKLVIRERELELKLAELDKQAIPDKVLSIKERIMEMLQDEQVEFPRAQDRERQQRIEERLQLESLIDAVFTSEAAERIKQMLKKEVALKEVSREKLLVNLPRPYRDLDVQVPTAKGEGYELPDIRTKTDD